MDSIKDRLAKFRAYMQESGLSAFIIPSTDPHMSEYVASRWKSREYISGFDGSAGLVVVTADKAGLWTDSRYFLQAGNQLEGSGIDLFKDGLPETPDFLDWILGELNAGECVGLDGTLFPVNKFVAIQNKLGCGKIVLKSVCDPFDALWSGRPGIPSSPVTVYPIEFAGETLQSKIARIRDFIRDSKADYLFVSMLDEIAWTLNLRGNDIDFNPVFVSYLLVGLNEVVLFVDDAKLTAEVRRYLDENSVRTVSYGKVGEFLKDMSGHTVLMDKNKNSIAVENYCSNMTVVDSVSPVQYMKAVRNDVELKGLCNAMLKDGVALVRFQMWLESIAGSNQETEYTVGEKLHGFRSEQKDFVSDSFGAIVGYADNAAIVHYEAEKSTAALIKAENMVLIDSGGQYLDGTTDITRTIPLGRMSEESRRDYTLVLKGHIQLAMAHFPEGTRGTQLDVLARIAMWKDNANYLHGTGHGVGHFLNVHEGPQAIRMNDVPVALLKGMVTSNEPGLYKSGKHGIRIENLVLVEDAGAGEFGNFFKFETLTLCPIATEPVVVELMTGEEMDWLNNYHSMVYEKLSPYLNENEKVWLREKTKKI